MNHLKHDNACAEKKKRKYDTNSLQLISITDIFISPAEDLYVNHFFYFRIQLY